MNVMTSLSRWVLRVSFAILLVLGASFWHGQLLQLLPLHMGLGAVFVLALWAIGLSALVREGARGAGLLLIIVGIAVAAVGIGQLRLLSGPNHWVIQVVHLALGVGAVARAEITASRLKSAVAKPIVDRAVAP